MVNWRSHCSSRPAPTDPTRGAARTILFATLAATGGCGQAADRPPAGSTPSAAEALCRTADDGRLEARLQGAIDAEIAWGPEATHCLGGVRPSGDGLRLIYKGSVPDDGPLLLVIGAAPLRPGESARNVPVNLTVVREGSGQFFATQGDDKCAFDEVLQAPIDGAPNRYRLTGRGYCIQPARAVGGDGAVLLSRFDVVAVVDADVASPATAAASAPSSGEAAAPGS